MTSPGASPSIYRPNIPWPKNVRALVTTRFGGVSNGGKESFNLATHVSDDPIAVAANRLNLLGKLTEFANVPITVHWLQQVHECRVASLSTELCTQVVDGEANVIEPADGAGSSMPGQVCAVLTADCMPVLMSSADGQKVAATHAGWRGLASGILFDSLLQFSGLNTSPMVESLVYLGPAISAKNYEVGAEVKEQVIALAPQVTEKLAQMSEGKISGNLPKTLHRYETLVASCFDKKREPGKYQFDLYALAKGQLGLAGIHRIYGGNYCTFDDERWYSHRKTPESGRFASLIWRTY